jgi:hypothetical protein
MKGIGRSAYQLLCLSRLHGSLLVIAAAVTTIGLAARVAHPQTAPTGPLFVLAVVGMISTAIATAPTLLDGLLFRHLSAPRAIGLIPYGRLQMLIGAVLAQLLLSLLIAAAVAIVSGPSPTLSIAAVGTSAFAALSAQFLIFYTAAQFRLGGALVPFVYILGARLPSLAFPSLHAHDVFGTGIGLAGTLAATLAAWTLFSLRYLLVRQIGVAKWGNSLWEMPDLSTLAKQAPVADPDIRGPDRPDRRRAIRTLLTGFPSTRNLLMWTGFGYAVLFGYWLLTGVPRLAAHDPHYPLGLPVVVLALLPGSIAHPMVGRARALWLQAALDRSELFRIIETQCGLIVLLIAVPCVIFAALLQYLASPSIAQLAWMLLIAPASGMSMVYLTLLFIRGRWLADLPIVVTVALLWLSELVVTLANAEGAFPLRLLLVQILLVPLLREIARRRWQTIDWIINRPVRPAARAAA